MGKIMRLVVLLFGLALFTFQPETGSADPGASGNLVREVQHKLTETGFNPGPADGLMGAKTRSALRHFQAKHGLPTTGAPDTATLSALGILAEQGKNRVHAEKISHSPQVTPALTQTPEKPKLATEAPGWQTPDWIRLVTLVVLGLATLGLVGWLLASTLGGSAAYLLASYAAWSWAWSLEAGLAVVYVTPLLLVMVFKNLRAAVGVLVVLGVPIFLVSRYLLDSTLPFAVADATVLAVLLPLAVGRLLMLAGVIEPEDTVPRNTWSVQSSSHLPSYMDTYKSNAPSQSSSSPIRSR